ncbi:MAG: ABC-2 transporter permease [Deltaproteobacteria bacterium]|nr:ABC-2 transporter permease [Deltaproteobacteria bacterium]
MAGNIINLILKDFYILWRENRIGLILMIISTVISAFFAPIAGSIWLFFMFLNVCAIIMSLFNLEEKYRTEAFFASLPVSRREIVLSRYGAVIVIFLIYAVVTYLLDISNVIHADKSKAMSIPVGYYISVFFSLAILSSVTLPLYFKLGYTKAKGIEIFFIFLAILWFGYLRRNMEFREFRYTHILFSFDFATCLT